MGSQIGAIQSTPQHLRCRIASVDDFTVHVGVVPQTVPGCKLISVLEETDNFEKKCRPAVEDKASFEEGKCGASNKDRDNPQARRAEQRDVGDDT